MRCVDRCGNPDCDVCAVHEYLTRMIRAWDSWDGAFTGELADELWRAVDSVREWVGTDARPNAAPESPRRVTCRICKTTLRDHHRSGYCPDCWPRVGVDTALAPHPDQP